MRGLYSLYLRKVDMVIPRRSATSPDVYSLSAMGKCSLYSKRAVLMRSV